MHSSILPALTPAPPETSVSHPPLDLRNLSSPQPLRDPAKPQEQGNTKKKRRSLPVVDNTFPPIQQPLQDSPTPDSPELRPSAYGDPMKIAQYFPELN